MLETTMEYTRNTLYVKIQGCANKKGIQDLKRKMYHIIDDYDITDIVINIKGLKEIDKECFYDFLDDYDIEYGGNLEVVN